MSAKVTATLGSLNAATGLFTSDGAPFFVVITGTFVGTVTLQYTFDGGTTWATVQEVTTDRTWTTPKRASITNETEVGAQYRLIMSAYTSGSASVRFHQ